MKKTKGLTTAEIRESEARARASVGRRKVKAYKDYFKDENNDFLRKRINRQRNK